MRHGAKINWQQEPLCHLTAYIVGKYHWPLRERIARLITSEASLRASGEPWVAGKLSELLNVLIHELHLHVVREEQILFPYIGLLEQTAPKGITPAPFFGDIARLCGLLIGDGTSTAELLERLLGLLDNRAPHRDPEPLKGLRTELKSLRSELRPHFRLEEQVLFPRGVALDQRANGTLPRAAGHPASVTPIADRIRLLALVE